MRGTLFTMIFVSLLAGITPAHAGNTVKGSFFCVYIRDHPRPCGEHHGDELIMSFGVGSPPPMRGTQCAFLSRYKFLGITPAHAGNTFLDFVKNHI